MAMTVGMEAKIGRVSEVETVDGLEVTTTRDVEGNLLSVVKRKQGVSHCADGPAQKIYHENGQLEREIWFFEGHRHREDGPAETIYEKDGSVKRKTWFRNGWIVLDCSHAIDLARRKK